jgi:monofunctional glycosyltransferase
MARKRDPELEAKRDDSAKPEDSSTKSKSPKENSAVKQVAKPEAKSTQSVFRPRCSIVARLMVTLATFMVILPLFLSLAYTKLAPPISNVMMLRMLSGFPVKKQWTALEDISPALARAVITSEDARFCDHHGVDWLEMQQVITDVLDDDEGSVRGASTISMQTVKNLFLWDGRSFIRKALEMPLALWTDLIWTKRRTIELYLNIAEWGPGIFGAEAAARYHFNKSASQLNAREAALLAAALPNPLKRKPGKPSKGLTALASKIQSRISSTEPYLTCVP